MKKTLVLITSAWCIVTQLFCMDDKPLGIKKLHTFPKLTTYDLTNAVNTALVKPEEWTSANVQSEMTEDGGSKLGVYLKRKDDSSDAWITCRLSKDDNKTTLLSFKPVQRQTSPIVMQHVNSINGPKYFCMSMVDDYSVWTFSPADKITFGGSWTSASQMTVLAAVINHHLKDSFDEQQKK